MVWRLMKERCLSLSLGLDMGILGLVRILCIFCLFLPVLSRLSLCKELGRLFLSLKDFQFSSMPRQRAFCLIHTEPSSMQRHRARELCFSCFIRRWGTLYHHCTVHASPSSIHFFFFLFGMSFNFLSFFKH